MLCVQQQHGTKVVSLDRIAPRLDYSRTPFWIGLTEIHKLFWSDATGDHQARAMMCVTYDSRWPWWRRLLARTGFQIVRNK
jgi:hypothetical protein